MTGYDTEGQTSGILPIDVIDVRLQDELLLRRQYPLPMALKFKISRRNSYFDALKGNAATFHLPLRP